MSMILQSKGQIAAFTVGRQNGLRASYDAVEQLTEQLIAARAELQQARAERAAMMDKANEHVRKECEACRKELTIALEEVNQLRLLMFHQWTRTEADVLN